MSGRADTLQKVGPRDAEDLARRLDYCRIMLYVHDITSYSENERLLGRIDKQFPRTTPDGEANPTVPTEGE